MKKSYAKVVEVEENSIAQEVGIEKGDIILSINDYNVTDILEYKYLISDDYIEVLVQKDNNEELEIEIEKDFNEDLGIVFDNPLIDKTKKCQNKCIFCFVDQLPPNMRETLYFKDDDYRLSFLHGNYISLTNLSEDDIQKIISYKISPINISVHTTDPELRVKMFNNKNADKINSILDRLVSNGIIINCQIVVCPNVNDKDNLDKTIKDLSNFFPSIESVSVVPVGLTKYREGLYDLKPFDTEQANQLIDQVQGWQKNFRNELKTNFVFIADEFYILAERKIPSYEHYEDFLQLENGVGLLAKFKKEFYNYLDFLIKNDISIKQSKTLCVVTGHSSYEFINTLCINLEKNFNNIKINVVKISNNFFGDSVTVTGLITGTDIINQLKGKNVGQELIIPGCALKSDHNIFLDDVNTNDIEQKLDIKVKVSEMNGKDFIKTMLGRCQNEKTNSSCCR